ncbi:MAG: radical SAM protein [Sedimentisphaerales bacterium]|nr:radical SAM protein [Sedimentisphaerales bacterium]
MSVGVNLNPDQQCNFNCRYCQVHRMFASAKVSLLTGEEFERTLRRELYDVLTLATSGELFSFSAFEDVAPALRRVNDIALSGDGEPTAAKEFLPTCRICAEVKKELTLTQVKLVLLTNASLLDQPEVQEGLAVLDAHQGEIWAKLDAGTEDYYRYVNRSAIPFERILNNLAAAARQRPIIIQTLLANMEGKGPDAGELAAYQERLRELLNKGGSIKEIHLLTVARPPAENNVSALPQTMLEQVAYEIQTGLNLPVYIFPG